VIIKPPRLEPGDTIGVIAPAGPVSREEIQPTIDALKAKGYHVIEGPNLFSKKGYLAGLDEARLDDIHAMFSDSSVKAVFCARGGYGTIRILDKIDYNTISGNPKIIVGYSDITALLFAILRKAGMVTFHGPLMRDLAKDTQNNLDGLLNILSSRSALTIDFSKEMIINSGKARGMIIGGNLSIISSLIGTNFMPLMKGVILFIEDKGEPLYRIDRMLNHLKLSGLINNLSGLIAGDFVDCGDISDINRLLKDISAELKVPIVSGLTIGHGEKNLSIPIGLHGELDTERKRLFFPEAPVV
jgi:muramoyltetrapeptide carboxypeptidase